MGSGGTRMKDHHDIRYAAAVAAAACCFFLAAGPSLGEDVPAVRTLSWSECVQEALRNHPDLVSAQEAVRQAEADQGTSRSDGLPQISSELSAKRARTLTAGPTDTYSYSVTGKQLLFDGTKTSQAIREAAEAVKAAEYDLFVVSSNVRLSLRAAFAELLTAQDMVALTEQIRARREENLRLVQLRYEAGREHRGSVLTAEANLANAVFEVDQARRNLALSQTRLAKAVGWDRVEPLAVIGDFSVADQGTSLDMELIADQTPLLLALAARKDAARYHVGAAKADFFPEIYASSSAGRSDTSWPLEREQWSAGLTVSIPIFEGGARVSAVSKARAKLRQAEADQRSGRDTILVTLHETWSGLKDAVETVAVRKKFLEAAEERATIADAQYSTGLISFDDWVIIEDNLVSARKAYLRAQGEALTAEAVWVQAKGGVLNDA